MKVERFEVPGLAQYGYIVSDGGEAIVIDPMRDFDRYTAYSAEHGLKITHVTETHIHADFASGARAMAQATGAELALSGHDEGEQYSYAMEHRALQDGDVLSAGKLRLQALHTPGHTPEHLSFLLFDTQRSATQAVALFSGDFLFVGGTGRPDLLGEAAKEQLVHELFCSLHARLAALGDGVQVYPGHGAGSLCGSGMSERAESTLGYERATNPLFGLAEQEFQREILASVPPMPAYYSRMKALNAWGACNLNELPDPQSFTAGEFASRMEDGAVVLDLRSAEAFGGTHIPGAIHIGLAGNFSLWAGWLLHPEDRLLLVTQPGDEDGGRRALARVGLDRVQGFLAKGMPGWTEAGLDFTGLDQVSTREVQRRGGPSVVLDVRTQKEWLAGHIEGAHHVPLGDLPVKMESLPKDRLIMTVCGSGYRSSIAASLLQRGGFAQVASMDGGMTAWKRRGMPLTLA